MLKTLVRFTSLALFLVLLGLLYNVPLFSNWVNGTPYLVFEDPYNGNDLARFQPMRSACVMGQILWFQGLDLIKAVLR